MIPSETSRGFWGYVKDHEIQIKIAFLTTIETILIFVVCVVIWGQSIQLQGFRHAFEIRERDMAMIKKDANVRTRLLRLIANKVGADPFTVETVIKDSPFMREEGKIDKPLFPIVNWWLHERRSK